MHIYQVCINYAVENIADDNLQILYMLKNHILFSNSVKSMTFNFGHKCTTNENNANHLKSIFNKRNNSKLSSLT